jgi:general secretion pathway protein L
MSMYRHAAEFLDWWWQRLCDLAPPRWRGRDLAQAGFFVTLDSLPAGTPASVHLSLRRKGRNKELGRFVLDEAGIRAALRMVAAQSTDSVVLVLPGMALLEREAILPLAAERDPGRVLHYEMDRITPFAAEEVFWTWTIERRERARGQLHLRLSLTPKAPLQGLFAALSRIGLAPTALEGRVPGGQNRRIALSRPPSRSERWRRRARAAGTAGCAGLAVAAAVQPFVQQSIARNDIEAGIAALRPRVEQAEGIRRRIAAAEAGGDVLAAERARVGDALQAIAVVTRLLPDDTYLTDFALRQRQITLSGESTAAAKLIAALSAEATIRNAAFVAPITRAESSHADLFSIRAELVP